MRFVPTYEIRSFLNRPENVKRMTDASDHGRPAVEPLQHDLVAEFGWGVKADSAKKAIGHETRKIMAANGYTHAEKGVPVAGSVFSVASTYEKIRW